jgi:hypothetical protein
MFSEISKIIDLNKNDKNILNKIQQLNKKCTMCKI